MTTDDVQDHPTSQSHLHFKLRASSAIFPPKNRDRKSNSLRFLMKTPAFFHFCGDYFIFESLGMRLVLCILNRFFEILVHF